MDEEEKLLLGYKEALAQLRLYPTLVWTRNNFFILTQSGLLAFMLNAERRPGDSTRLVVCVAGLLLAVAWLWVNWAGRQLHRQWRAIVLEFEEELFARGEGELRGPYQRAAKLGSKHPLLSITLMLMLLSSGFIILWVVLLVRLFL